MTGTDGECEPPPSEGRHMVDVFFLGGGGESEKPSCNGLDMYRGEDGQLPARHEIYGSREKALEVRGRRG